MESKHVVGKLKTELAHGEQVFRYQGAKSRKLINDKFLRQIQRPRPGW